MNTNGNTYTVIYSVVLVVIVAAVLAFVAMSLQDKQNENIKIETITKVLSAASQADENVTIDETTDVLKMYTEKITDAFEVDGTGSIVRHLEMGKDDPGKIKVPSTADLKKQNDLIKKAEAAKSEAEKEGILKGLSLPVFVFDINGKAITVIPCYGAGLWGPIWGYIALAGDGKTIKGAIFDHKGETPGLGAKIAEAPFYNSFRGKAFGEGEPVFAVEKGKHDDVPDCVDAISGATITSQALGRGINLWATYYQPYLRTMAAAAAAPAETVPGDGTAPADTSCTAVADTAATAVSAQSIETVK